MPLPFICLWYYGRVSLASGIGLRVGMLVPLLSAMVYSVICIREKRWASGALLLLVCLALAGYLFPVFTHL